MELIGRQRNDPVLLALSSRFSQYDWLEIGWGDETFYRFAPTLSDVSIKMGFNALAGLNGTTVLHVVGLYRNGPQTFPNSDVVEFTLGTKAITRLMDNLSANFATDKPARQPIELGPGIYGPSLFFKATGHYSIIRTCNRWIADLIHSAGLASSPVPAVLSAGLMAELRWRNY